MDTTTFHQDDRALVTWLAEQPGGAVKMPDAQITKALGWGDNRARGKRAVDRLLDRGAIVQRRGRTILNRERVREILLEPRANDVRTEPANDERTVRGDDSRSSSQHAEPFAGQIPPYEAAAYGGAMVERAASDMAGYGGGGHTDPAPRVAYGRVVGNPGGGGSESMTALDVLTMMAALSLAGVAAYLSVNGFVVLFPGLPMAALWLGCSLEFAKLCSAGWLGHRWRDIGWIARLFLLGFTLAAAGLNASGVYSQLVQAHVGPRGAASAGREASDAEAAGRIDVAQGRVADLDRRIGQIDGAVDTATRRGRTRGAMNLAADQRRNRDALVRQRDEANRDLAGLRSQRTGAAAQGRAAEQAELPIAYLAELLGINKGGEELIRWVIAGIVGCTDPFAIALLAAIASRRRRWGGAA